MADLGEPWRMVLDDAMLRSMAMGRCPYHDGAHEFVMNICRFCLENRGDLLRRAEGHRVFEIKNGDPVWSGWGRGYEVDR